MPKIHIDRSLLIDAPAEKIYPALSDFNHWPDWSPWLIMEPDVVVTVAEDSKYYEWNGKRVGSGNMTVLKEEKNKWIDYDLTFLKPWKSQASVRFELDAQGDQTRVTWSMDSSLPFFMFWMKKSMEAYVGMDYVRGLMMLKDYIEKGAVYSRLDFRGESEFPGAQYVGIKTTGSIKEVGELMQADFEKLETFMHKNKDIASGKAFSIYHDWDVVQGKTTYTACVGVTSEPLELDEGMLFGSIPATPVYTLRHIGSYHHLGNAWGTLMSMDRSKEFKKNKAIHPFEEYITDPKETEEKDHITDIHFAIR